MKKPRSIAPYLLGVALFEASLLAGSHAAELFRPRRAAIAAALPGAESQLAQWRRETLRGIRDPAPGQPAPRMQLRTPTGAAVALDGKERVVLIFAPEAAG